MAFPRLFLPGIDALVSDMKERSRRIATSSATTREALVATYILFGGGMAIGLAIAIWGIWNLR